jgi:hypothetical protein
MKQWYTSQTQYCQCLLAGGKMIDMKNYSNDLRELETHIKALMEKVEGGINIMDECLIHFQTPESRAYPK